jgi:hypothetical protein
MADSNLLDRMRDQLFATAKSIKESNVTGKVLEGLEEKRDALQGKLNEFLSKKGLVSETDKTEAEDAIRNAKKAEIEASWQRKQG